MWWQAKTPKAKVNQPKMSKIELIEYLYHTEYFQYLYHGD